MIPSLETIGQAFGVEKARAIRSIMEQFVDRHPLRNIRPVLTLEKISSIIGGCGVEYISRGNGAKSPAITYVNIGDTYDTTVMWVRGRFQVGSWGDIVECGNYE